MPKIKNKRYKEFLDSGNINIIDQKELEELLKKVNGHHIIEARCMIITMYITGARPNEILRIKGKDIYKESQHLNIALLPSKNGIARTLKISCRRFPLANELWNYASTIPPEMFLFWPFRSKSIKRIKLKNGETKVTTELSSLLRYYFRKWFDNEINPYFFRHNLFSRMAMNGATPTEIRITKGAKSLNSVVPYEHMSKIMLDNISKKLF